MPNFKDFYVPFRQTIPRPASTIPKSSSSNSIRKEFALDVDTEPISDNLGMPQLIQHDLDHLYEPIKLPKIRYCAS